MDGKFPKIQDAESESSLGIVWGVSGPVVTAKHMEDSYMHEVVHVGHFQLVGEIIKLHGDKAIIQVYEDTTGLTVGDPVRKTGKTLSLELGPGLLDNIFDGIQRPLNEIWNLTKSMYIPKGVSISPLSHSKSWQFSPSSTVQVGSYITGGDIFGITHDNAFIDYKIMLPPNACGKVTYIAPAGNYTIDESVLEVEFKEETHNYSMLQVWPVRTPRPVCANLWAKKPYFTGQRILDTLMPCIEGGTTTIAGGFGCGKTCISQAIAKYTCSDAVVYVGCGERGNEMAEVLKNFPQLMMEVNGKKESIMKRTSLISNTSNMPVAAREASIYTGITMAEYYRDMGLRVSMLADSTSRWAEALREVSNRLGEMPSDSGFPAYMGGHLASFYERAGQVKCLGNPKRKGSITIFGVVSPPGSDFTDPVTRGTAGIVQNFWGLDKGLAEILHFPAINWVDSFSKGEVKLESYYRQNYPYFVEDRDKLRRILQKSDSLKDIIKVMTKESLQDVDRCTEEVATLIKESFLQQNAFTPYDCFCPFYKTVGMLRNFITFHDQCQQIVKCTAEEKKKVTWNSLKSHAMIHKLSNMKTINTFKENRAKVIEDLDEINDFIKTSFRKIVEHIYETE